LVFAAALAVALLWCKPLNHSEVCLTTV